MALAIVAMFTVGAVLMCVSALDSDVQFAIATLGRSKYGTLMIGCAAWFLACGMAIVYLAK